MDARITLRRITNVATHFGTCEAASIAADAAPRSVMPVMPLDQAQGIVEEFEARAVKRGKPSNELRMARAALAGETIVVSEADFDLDVPKGITLKAEAILASAHALAVKKSRLQRILDGFRLADEDRSKAMDASSQIDEDVAALYGRIKALSPDLFARWQGDGGETLSDEDDSETERKAHLTGEDAADRNADGFAWQSSDKGYAADARYASKAQGFRTNNGAVSAAQGIASETYSVDEAAILETFDAETEALISSF